MPEHHRLQVEAAAVGQQARDPGEDSAVELLLAPRAVLLGRAEVLEGAEARYGVKRAEAVASDLSSVAAVNVEAVPPARGRLRGGQRDADPDAPLAPHEIE